MEYPLLLQFLWEWLQENSLNYTLGGGLFCFIWRVQKEKWKNKSERSKVNLPMHWKEQICARPFRISMFVNSKLLRPNFGIMSRWNKSKSEHRDVDEDQALKQCFYKDYCFIAYNCYVILYLSLDSALRAEEKHFYQTLKKKCYRKQILTYLSRKKTTLKLLWDHLLL